MSFKPLGFDPFQEEAQAGGGEGNGQFLPLGFDPFEEEAGDGVLPALSRVARKAPGSLGQFLGGATQFAGERLQNLATLAQGDIMGVTPEEEKDTAAYRVVKGAGEQLSAAGAGLADVSEQRIERINREKPERLQQRLWDDPSLLASPSWLVENAGDAAVSMVPTLAAHAMGGGLASGLVGGGMEGASLYRELAGEGVPEDRAAVAATAYGAVSGALNAIGAGKVLEQAEGKGLAKKLAKWVAAGGTEALTEYAEEPAQAGIGAVARDKGAADTASAVVQSLKNVDVIPGAFITGAGGSALSDVRLRKAKADGAAKAEPDSGPARTPESGKAEAANEAPQGKAAEQASEAAPAADADIEEVLAAMAPEDWAAMDAAPEDGTGGPVEDSRESEPAFRPIPDAELDSQGEEAAEEDSPRAPRFESEVDAARAWLAEAGKGPVDLSSPEVHERILSTAVDSVSGFTDARTGRSRQRTIERAQDFVDANDGQQAHYAEIDLKNLGGLNAAMGASAANGVFRRVADTIRAEFRSLDGRASLFRHGGDEMSAVVVGPADAASIEQALARANERVRAWSASKTTSADAPMPGMKLADIPHPKYKGDLSRSGIGITFGISRIRPGASLGDIIGAADRDLEVQKKAGQNEHQGQAVSTRTVASGGQAGGVAPGVAQATEGSRGADGAGPRGPRQAQGEPSQALTPPTSAPSPSLEGAPYKHLVEIARAAGVKAPGRLPKAKLLEAIRQAQIAEPRKEHAEKAAPEYPGAPLRQEEVLELTGQPVEPSPAAPRPAASASQDPKSAEETPAEEQPVPTPSVGSAHLIQARESEERKETPESLRAWIGDIEGRMRLLSHSPVAVRRLTRMRDDARAKLDKLEMAKSSLPQPAAQGQEAFTEQEHPPFPEASAILGVQEPGQADFQTGQGYVTPPSREEKTPAPAAHMEAPQVSAAPDPSVAEKPARAEPEASPSLTISDFSPTSIIVKGDTWANRATLKSLKGLWNKGQQGWVYPKTRESAVRQALEEAGLAERPNHEPNPAQPELNPAQSEQGRWSDKKGEQAQDSAPKEQTARPHDVIADWVGGRLEKGAPFSNRDLFSKSAEAYGGTLGMGAFTAKDAYDAMELGVNKYIAAHPGQYNPASADVARAKSTADDLTAMIKSVLPTQNKRTAEQDEFQQFSTPPALAFVANWIANPRAGEVVLEPSAGIGGLAVFAKNAGAKVVVNELSSRRREVLASMGFERVFGENAEQLNNILPKDVHPSTVVMNPPFSSTAGRVQGMRDTRVGAKHVEQALARLQPGGRLVAIVGQGMADNRPAFKGWWNRIKSEYNVRANVSVSGKDYGKYGTTFDNQVVVIDKVGVTPKDGTLTGSASSAGDVVSLLEGIRNDRHHPEDAGRRGEAELAADQPTGQAPASRGGRNALADRLASSSAPGVGERAGSVDAGLEAGGRPRRDRSAPAVEQPEGGDGVPDADGRRRGARPGPRGAGAAGRGRASDGGVGLDDGGQAGELQVTATKLQPAKEEINEAAVFDAYRPSITVPGAKAHPTKLAESSAMAAVQPVIPDYRPNLPASIVKDGRLSDAQLETIIYAGNAHKDALPDGRRKGYFIGDGTGVGKGREISGILWDNWNRGRKKHVWISEKSALFTDAKRDLAGVGWSPDVLFDLSKIKADKPIERAQGIIFTTYDTLKSGAQGESGGRGKSRVDQIVDWLGKDFDGVIAFDEAHNMGNAVEQKGGRGKKKAAQKALAGITLQAALPSARVVYVSATGATEVANLSYADRLGLWGEGTPFNSREKFVTEVSAGGVAAMELCARDMKAMGLYLARNLDFAGVTYDRLEHRLTPEQVEIYDALAEGWQVVLRNINEALEETGAGKDGRAKSAAMSAFWGAHQRFFNQVITSMQTPAVVKAIKQDLKDGKAAVIQLVSTMEASTERALSRQEEGMDLEDLDITPRDQLLQYLEKSFPTQAYEESMDASGNVVMRPVKDSEGRPVHDARAVAKREALLDRVASIKVPESPVDMILNAFGTDAVAEITGRSRRVVWGKDDSGARRKVIEKRSDAKARIEADEFMDDKRQILIFSDKGGTGRSYHADRAVKNQRPRVHYLLQPGWRADKAVQGFGRTHRSNQVQPPHYALVTTSLKAQKRFLSSIARRLDQLGALTKGQRQAGSQGFFDASDNLESSYAKDALKALLRDISLGGVSGVDALEFERQTGLSLTKADDVQVTQFLNRLLSLKTDMMDKVFDAFSARMDRFIRSAIDNGTLDAGLETIKAQRIDVVKEEVVHVDERTKAETKYVALDLTQPTPIRSFAEIKEVAKAGFYVNKKSGQIWAASEARRSTNPETGAIEDEHALYSVRTLREVSPKALAEKFERVDVRQAMALWDKAVEATPKTFVERKNLITGVILPIWDRLKGHARIVRVQASDGRRMIGRLVNDADLADTLQNLGATSQALSITPAQAVDDVLESGATLWLANDWRIKRSIVSGEPRLEILGPEYADRPEMDRKGVIFMRDNYRSRFFIPTDERAAAVLAEVIKGRPISRVERAARLGRGDARLDFSLPLLRSGDGRALSSDRINAHLAPILSRWRNAPAVRVVQSEASLPQWIKSEIEAAGYEGRVDALFDRAGQAVWIVADKFDSLSQVERKLFHEAYGHYGLRGLLGRKADPVLLQAFVKHRRGLIQQIADQYGYDLSTRLGRLQAAEEVLAHLAETHTEPGVVRRAIAAVRQWLRDMGLSLKLTDNDIRALIARAARWVEDGGPAGGGRESRVPAAPVAFVQASLDDGQAGGPGSPAFSTPETEARYREARTGLADQRGLAKRVQDWSREIARGFSRHYLHLPSTPEFAKAHEALRQLEAAPQAAKEEAVRALERVTRGLTPAQYDLFSRKVILDDLAFEAERGHELPFGFTPETLEQDQATVDAAVDAAPKIRDALAARKKLIDSVTSKLVAGGILTEEQVQNPAYFRHQVLDYARAWQFAQGSGKALKKPRPGYAKRREGSALDINANYLEAEFEFLHRAMVDLKTVEALGKIRREYDRKADVKDLARQANDATLKALILAEQEGNPLAPSATDERLQAFRKGIAMGFSRARDALRKAGHGGLNIPDRYRSALSALLAPRQDVEDGQAAQVRGDVLGLLKHLLDKGLPGADGAAQVFKAIQGRQRFIEQTLGENFKTWRDVVPAGYALWQPEKGNVFFTGRSIGEKAMDRLMDLASSEVIPGVDAGALADVLKGVRKALMVGGRKTELVLPEALATTLDNLRPAANDGLFDKVFSTPLGWWKRWVLVNPRRFIKYNLNNLSGDLDAVIAGNPRALKRLPQAVRELYDVMQGREPTRRYLEATERGVFDSGLSIQEIPDINALSRFQLLKAKRSRMPTQYAIRIWRAMSDYTQFRENWLRYAAYLDYVTRLEAGETPKSIGYGASDQAMVDALADPRDRAALMARDLLGDYGAVSHYGQSIRRKLIPFYSWMEINTKRYLRLLANAYSQGLGQGLATSATLGALAGKGAVMAGARTSAWLGLRMFLLYGLIQAWNNLVHPDEEDDLPADERARLHLTLGRAPNGEIIRLRLQGALSDFLGWIGLEDAASSLVEISKGRAGIGDLLLSMAKAPVNKIAGGVTPLIKTPVELATGKRFYPDVFSPRSSRDGVREAFRLWSLENEYDWLTGKPSRGYLRSWVESAVSVRNPGEESYDAIRDLVARYRERKGIEGGSDMSTPRSRAVREYKQALRFEDQGAAKAALGRLHEMGLGEREVTDSVLRAAPLAGLSRADREDFLAGLSPQEKAKLDRAEGWYADTFLDADQTALHRFRDARAGVTADRERYKAMVEDGRQGEARRFSVERKLDRRTALLKEAESLLRGLEQERKAVEDGNASDEVKAARIGRIKERARRAMDKMIRRGG